MILVDSSIWIDHFRELDPFLLELLEDDIVLCHPFVIGEVMMGTPRDRPMVKGLLNRLQQARIASDLEVVEFIEQAKLYGTGIGYIDAHLLASALIDRDTTVWTRDRRMAKTAEMLGVYAPQAPKLQ